MNRIIIPKYDYGYQEQFTIFTDSTHSAVQNLADYTIKCKVWSQGEPTTLIVDSVCTTITPATGICYWTITSSLTSKVGYYLGEIQLEKEGVVMSTLPFEVAVVESAQ